VVEAGGATAIVKRCSLSSVKVPVCVALPWVSVVSVAIVVVLEASVR